MACYKKGCDRLADLLRTGDKRIFYRYSIENFTLLYESDSKEIPIERIDSFSILNDYIVNLYPMIKIVFRLEESVYNEIKKNKKDVRVKLNIRKFYHPEGAKATSMKKSHINTTFNLILDDEEDNTKDAIRKKNYPDGDEGHMEAINKQVELFLYQSSVIKGNTDVVNLPAENCTVTAALCYIIANSNIKNIIMTKPDNAEVYDELVIPPMKIGRALGYLDSFYGLYDTGSIIYLGLRKSYFLKYRYSKNAHDPDDYEKVSIIVPNTGSSISDESCQILRRINENEYTLIVDPTTFDPKEESESASAMVNADVAIIDDGEISGEIDDDVAIETPKGVNPYYRKTYQAIATPYAISCTFKNCDVDAFTPDKKYQFLFENSKMTKKYKGYYSLVKANVTYLKTGSEFAPTIIATFHKNVE